MPAGALGSLFLFCFTALEAMPMGALYPGQRLRSRLGIMILVTSRALGYRSVIPCGRTVTVFVKVMIFFRWAKF